MRVSKPLDSITSGTQLLILRQLSTHKDTELTETQLAGLCDCSRQAVHMNLESLVEEDLVLRRKVGNVNLLRMNSHNSLVQKIIELFDLESRLKGEIVNELKGLWGADPNIQMVYLFGSVARGEDSPSSDVDVLVSVNNEASFKGLYEEKLEEIEKKFSKRISINLNDHIKLAVVDFGREEPLIKSIFKEGIWVCGKHRLVLDKNGRLGVSP